jgi:phosphatidylinositol glycan class O
LCHYSLGLLTGGLPTFVDVSNSFGAAELAEDNLVAQAASAGRRVALSGDDTWMELFHRSHFAGGTEPFPSFNVKDLDTVDRGVRRHLMSALGRDRTPECQMGCIDHAGCHQLNSVLTAKL